MNKKRDCFGKYINSSSVCYECQDEADCIAKSVGLKRSNRMSKDEYYLLMALSISKRSTCLRRHYGCVIVKNDEVIATGYNGSARGEENCCDCGVCNNLKHERNDGNYADCPSVHAEQNAMISASRKDMLGSIMYIACENYVKVDAGGEIGEWIEDVSENVHPCKICSRMLKNAGVDQVISRNNIWAV